MTHKNKIYCGKRVFNKILRETKSICVDDVSFEFADINFVLNEYISPTSVMSLDPDLSKVLKEIEQS